MEPILAMVMRVELSYEWQIHIQDKEPQSSSHHPLGLKGQVCALGILFLVELKIIYENQSVKPRWCSIHIISTVPGVFEAIEVWKIFEK